MHRLLVYTEDWLCHEKAYTPLGLFLFRGKDLKKKPSITVVDPAISVSPLTAAKDWREDSQ